MATLTLRGTKGSPLTHVELDANFVALDSEFRGGIFDSGLEVSGGAVISDGDLEVVQGNLILNAGDIHYNPKLGFIDLIAGSERARFDSDGSLLIGSKVNSQSAKVKSAGEGNQTILFGNSTSNSGQTTFVQLGAAGTGTHKSGGIKATQMSADFENWKISLVSYNGSSYINALDVNPDGSIDFNTKVEFHDSASFDNGISVSGDALVDGDLEITGAITINGGAPISSGTVESVGLNVPTGFTIDNSPITVFGIFELGYDSGYQLLNDSDKNNWNLTLEKVSNLDSSIDSVIADKITSGELVSGDTQILAGNGLQGGGTLDSDVNLAMDSQYTGNFSVDGNITSTGDVNVDGTINADGDVVAFYNASDERLKSNITEIENALEKVSSLRGVQFEYTSSGIASTGLIAQDLEPILPEAVFEDDDGYKGIRYQLTVGLLVEAIKELKAEIEELKKAK